MSNVLIYLGMGVLVVLALFLFSALVSKVQAVKRKLFQKYTVLQVRVSKENETGPIAAEHIFSTLHGIQTSFTWWERLNGLRPENVSFEIASINRSIKFYVAFPEKLRNLVEGQIYAQYPDVEIEDCNDYSRLSPQMRSKAMGVELELNECDVFPIKRYPQFEDKLTRIAVDPLAGITSALVKFEDIEDQAWVQIVVSPLHDKWRIIFTKCVKILKKGVLGNINSLKNIYSRAFVTRKLWPRVVFFPVYLVFWFQGLLVTAGVNSDMGSRGAGISSADDIDELTSKSHDRESNIDAAMDKVVRLLYQVSIRIVYVPKETDKQSAKLSCVKLLALLSSLMFLRLMVSELVSLGLDQRL